MKEKTRLILALDVTDEDIAVNIAHEIADHVDAIKIGYPLVLSTGLSIFDEISEYAPVIADFKVADIPNTNRLICSQAFEANADAIIVHAFPGSDSIKECVNVAREYDKDVYVVTEMSHPGAMEFMQEKGLRLAALAIKCGAKGIIAPATRPESIAKLRDVVGTKTIISPGVGTQGGKASDAIKAGADYIIVGRKIYESRDPKSEAKKLNEEIFNSVITLLSDKVSNT